MFNIFYTFHTVISYTIYTKQEGHPYITFEDLKECNEGLICLSGGCSGPIGFFCLNKAERKADFLVKYLKEAFQDRFYLELSRHGLKEEDTSEEYFIIKATFIYHILHIYR